MLVRILVPLVAAAPLAAQTDWSVQYSQPGNISLGVDAVDADHAYIAGATDGISPHIGRTQDGGATWQFSYTDIGLSMFWLDLDMADTQTGFAGGLGVFSPGAAKTTDGGVTWTPVLPFGPVSFATAYEDVFALDANHVWYVGFAGGFLGEKEGIARSSDGGTTWTFSDPQSGSPVRRCFFLNPSDGWLVSGEWPNDEGGGQYRGVIQRTTDGGTTWQTQLVTDQHYFNGLHFTDAQNGWVAADGPASGVVYHTTDGGATWTTQTLLPGALELGDVEFFDPQNGWAVGWTPGLINPVLALFHTANGGATWEQEPFTPQCGPINIAFADPKHGWTVGANNLQMGSILAYDAGGAMLAVSGDPSLGGAIQLELSGAPGDLAIVAIGTVPASIPTPWGTLQMDPSVSFLTLGPFSLPGPMGELSVPVGIPQNPNLVGQTALIQALIGNFQPGAELTNLESVTVLP